MIRNAARDETRAVRIAHNVSPQPASRQDQFLAVYPACPHGQTGLLTLLALALLLGIFWVVSGMVELFTALSHRELHGRGWTSLMGILSVVAGLIVLAYPGITLVTLALVLSFWLLIFGVMQIALALRLRSA
jgi:uncharacterized membrane protein HdeD (DUF308 family)